MIKELTKENTPEVLKKCAEGVYPDKDVWIEVDAIGSLVLYGKKDGRYYLYLPQDKTQNGAEQWKDLLMAYRAELFKDGWRYDSRNRDFTDATRSEEALVIAYYNLKMEG